MKKNRSILVLFLIILLTACQGLKKQELENIYFDLEGLLEKQTANLLKEKALLKKIAIIGNETDTVTYEPDSSGWIHEFDIFRSASLGAPALRGMYEELETKEEQSNLIKRTYRAREDDLKVQEMNLYFLDSEEHIYRIEIRYRDKNIGYTASRKLSLRLIEQFSSQPMIVNWTINSTLSVVGMDSLCYELNAEVIR